jgi:hypothetical protein
MNKSQDGHYNRAVRFGENKNLLVLPEFESLKSGRTVPDKI